MKKTLSVLLIVVMLMGMCLNMTGCSDPAGQKASENRQIVDMRGYTVDIPGKVSSYIVLWKSYTGIMAMLDGCAGLKGCDFDAAKSKDAWLFTICPDAKQLTVVTEEITAEEVAGMNVDVVFWQNDNCEELAKQLRDLGIAAVNVDFTDYESMKKSVSIAAEVLGTREAKAKADTFNTYLDKALSDVTSVTGSFNDADKLTVVNLRSVETLRADGGGTVADTWINAVGAINMVGANNLKGNQYLEIEQLYDWDPDIIVSSVAGDDAVMYSDDVYAPLSAVANKKVYVNPYGIFAWNRYSVETPLQLYWAAKTFYPDSFENIDIATETKNFYKTFFGYELSEENAANILAARAPSK